MAIITIVASALLWGAFLYAYSGRTWRFVRLMVWGLPLSAVVNLFVKSPVGQGVGALAGIDPGQGLDTPVWFLVFLFLLAPVFEELIKVAPALLPSVRPHATTPDDALWTGLALGMGFGIGEAAYLGWQIALSSAYEQYAWYMFSGFLGERLVVVLLHGFMTALLMWFAARGRPVIGYLAAVGAHALLNSGAMLFQLGLVAEGVAGLSLLVVLVVAVIVFERIRPRYRRDESDVVYYSADD
ncbi:MAG: YhfC family glutamic-type intramembrane protease [Coriobacteriia bacterium]|nr:YhfC family glutamic-type intramembrane protease [Coriobacteriia bacterium]